MTRLALVVMSKVLSNKILAIAKQENDCLQKRAKHN